MASAWLKIDPAARTSIQKFLRVPADTISESRNLYCIIAALMMIIGGLLRFRQYAINRSFWIDEASLALNIVHRSFAGLLQPLDYVQGAPIGFLFTQKAILLILGNRDYVLRLFPFAVSILALLMMNLIAKWMIGGKSALLALFWFAISERLIYYASELKQYSSDVFITLLLLYIFYKCLEPERRVSRFVQLGCIGVISIFFSHASVFILSAGFFVLILDLGLKREWRQLKWVLLNVLACICVFSALYFLSFRSLARNSALMSYWQFSFMPMPPWKDVEWLKNSILNMFLNPGGFELGYLASAAFLLGGISFLRRRWQLGLILMIPFATALLASGFRKYPFSDRMLLFLLPLMLILIAQGIEQFSGFFRKINPLVSYGVWGLTAAILTFAPFLSTLDVVKNPKVDEHIKPLLTYLIQNYSEDDLVYVYYGAQPAFDYYSTYIKELDQMNVHKGIAWKGQEPQEYIEDIKHLRGSERVWFLFSHNCFWCLKNEEEFIRSYLDQIGIRLETEKSIGASLYLFRLPDE